MASIRRFLLRLVSFFRSGRAEAELAREINSHLQLLEDEFLAQGGLSAGEARSAARRSFGGVEQVKEHQRDARSFRWLDSWWLDCKLGVRMLVKYPGLTLVCRWRGDGPPSRSARSSPPRRPVFGSSRPRT